MGSDPRAPSASRLAGRRYSRVRAGDPRSRFTARTAAVQRRLPRALVVMAILGSLHCTTSESDPVSRRLEIGPPEVEQHCSFRAGLVCGQEYQPVCALTRGGGSTNYANACQACRDPFVLGYRGGRCQKPGIQRAEERAEPEEADDAACESCPAAAASEAAAPAPPPGCPYKKVFIDPENAILSGRFSKKSEAFRQRYLELAPAALEGAGFEVAQGASEGWLVLNANSSLTAAGNVEIGIGMRPTVRMFHHIFLIMMDDPALSRDENRWATRVTRELIGDRWKLSDAEALFEDALGIVLERNSPALEALCSAHSRLVDEGWAEVEELREKLVEEMIQLRREKREATRRKQLRVEIEEGAGPPPPQ